MSAMTNHHYRTAGGVRITRQKQPISYDGATDDLCQRLDTHRGVLLGSSFDFPGRYSRWDIGFINPPLVITARGRKLSIEALNRRGRVLLPEILRAVEHCAAADRALLREITTEDDAVHLRVAEPEKTFSESLRSRQPSVFSVLRAIIAHFGSDADSHLGFYGAFGYDLAFQFEAVHLNAAVRAADSGAGTARDMVLYLPDDLVVVDHHSRVAHRIRYEFVCRRRDQKGAVRDAQELDTTGGMARDGTSLPWVPAINTGSNCDHQPGEYVGTVNRALEYFRQGKLFEVVPGQVFRQACQDSPSRVFQRLRRDNPAPYGALMNLGDQEYLVAASPEMYVRVQGDQAESCPISGTIARGADAIEDARQIRILLNSAKDEAELSMCTDVDRNDKARICVPGSVRVVGRRQVELYSRLIHTVDHVKGTLAPEYDALDAFLAHAWAVTVTGAPKADAMQFIEDHERSPRHWYGGAMGHLGFDGNMNTGLTLRTIRILRGVAEVRAGATLLVDSDPEAEEAETRLKASALLAALKPSGIAQPDDTDQKSASAIPDASQLNVLMIDHRDSFVHNLGAYFREYGVNLLTLRPEPGRELLASDAGAEFDLVVLSPGPGAPQDFDMHDTLALCLARNVPVFGVCLGLQGIVSHFGGKLALLDTPVHGKASTIRHTGKTLFDALPSRFQAGRYHSLHAVSVPDCLEVIAQSADDAAVVMAVQHRNLPISAVQFHPESLLTLDGKAGHVLIGNVVAEALSRQQLCDNREVPNVFEHTRST